MLLAGWFTLPLGYNTIIQWLAPQLGNYIRPALVMVNALLLNPLNNWVMVAIWAGAGLLGGMIAGTKAGAFVVGLVTWFCCMLILAFCVVQLFVGGLNLGALPPIPPGTSIVDILSIPLVKSAIGDVLALIAGGGGGLDPLSLILPMVIYLVVPIIVVTVSGIIGATIRKKE